MSDGYLTLATLLLFLGAMGKSAQVPFHVWLPDAMEGPTPVSALIHAATMVVAGVYLVARMLPVFDVAPGAARAGAGRWSAHSLLAGAIAISQTDIQKGAGLLDDQPARLHVRRPGRRCRRHRHVHLVTHAFFKAALFLGSGSVIHITEEQEVSKLGGLWWKMPITTITFTLSAMALAGIAPLSGFFSKDEIFAVVSSTQDEAILVLLGISAFLSALYMARLVILTFFGPPKDLEVIRRAKEADPLNHDPPRRPHSVDPVRGLVCAGPDR